MCWRYTQVKKVNLFRKKIKEKTLNINGDFNQKPRNGTVQTVLNKVFMNKRETIKVSGRERDST